MQQSTYLRSSCDELRRRIAQVYELPSMPQMAQQILALRNEPNASVAALVRLVKRDPSLASQLMRYALSPFFGYRGKVESIDDAVTRVLGFDRVVDMALGWATSKSFRGPLDGPLGLHAFWHHAVYSAALAQAIANAVERSERPKPGMAYLAGLLHNFGFLLLGHLFPPEFQLLNKLVAANPQIPVTDFEKRVLGMGQARQCLGMGHAEVGAWLMEHWRMPAEITITLKEHHNPRYAGEHAAYPRLVLIADHLLKRYDIGDAPDGELPGIAIDALGIQEYQLVEITERLLQEASYLDGMARQLAPL